MPDITLDVIKQIYPIAKDVFEKNKSHADGRKILVKDAGMNSNSANDYINVFQKMMHGEEYQRTINEEATRYYFENIRNDFGKDILKKAIRATRLHLVYYVKKGKGKLNGISAICTEFSNDI